MNNREAGKHPPWPHSPGSRLLLSGVWVGISGIPSFSKRYDMFHGDIINIFAGTIYINIFSFLVRLCLHSLKLTSQADVGSKEEV